MSAPAGKGRYVYLASLMTPRVTAVGRTRFNPEYGPQVNVINFIELHWHFVSLINGTSLLKYGVAETIAGHNTTGMVLTTCTTCCNFACKMPFVRLLVFPYDYMSHWRLFSKLH